MKNVLVLLPVAERHKEKLFAAAEGCSFVFDDAKTVSAETVQNADIIIGNPKSGLIAASPRLELLQLESAGTDAYIVPGVLDAKTILTNSTGAYNKAVAEHALAMTLMLIKKLHLYRDNQQQRIWGDRGTVSSLTDAVVAVVGLGDIGGRYAEMVKALGAYVIGVKRRASECPPYVDELCLTEDLKTILPRADIVMSVLPNTGATRYIYTDECFDLMKPGAYFINCGRGNAVSAEVLYRAVKDKKIAGAAVDVTELEPLPAESSLWELEDLIITPHISGGHHLPETFERIVDIAAKNLRAYLKGGELMNVVDFSTGYKR